MKNKILLFPLIVMGLITFNSCKKDEKKDENPTPTVQTPVLTTNSVSSITTTTATCGGNISSDGGATITARGVCWSTGLTPTITDNKTSDSIGIGSFTSDLSGLSPNTAYNIRAYATNSAGTGYGNVISFTTLQVAQTVTDADGNVYHTITIGTQVWLVENLKTTKYRNSDPITNVTDGLEWSGLTSGAYCSYNNDANNSTNYGHLYNWFAVNDIRGLAPTGWHIPSDAEWTTLTTYLGGENVASGKLKESGLTHWANPNTGATNETGFTALPGGYRSNDGTFYYILGAGYWWSSTESLTNYGWYRTMFSYSSTVTRNYGIKVYGNSIRCIKD